MNIRNLLAICVLAFVPALAMSLPITSMPTDSAGGPGGPLQHNVFHDASVGTGGAAGNVLVWFDLGGPSSWDPTLGLLSLQIDIFDTPGGTLLGTGLGMSTDLFGAGFGPFDDSSLGFITWTFAGAGATGILGTGFTQEFINHEYNADNSGNLANTWVGNTVTLWGANGTSNGNGFFTGATFGVDMVFVVPEPAIMLLMAMGLLGIGVTARRR